jgi:hypothetical protein
MKTAMFDFFPYMWGYVFLFGTLLMKVTRKAGVTQSIAYLPVLALVCDWIETGVQMAACHTFPDRLSVEWVIIGGRANQAKWCFFGLSVLLTFGIYFFATEKKEMKNRKQK